MCINDRFIGGTELKQSIYTVESNKLIASNVYEIVLSGDVSSIVSPGQFVNIKLDGLFLRRPISVADYSADSLTLLIKVIGEGTEALAAMKEGEKLDLLTGLGNGFDLGKGSKSPLLIGGGIGCAPLFMLCKQLCDGGTKPTVVLGFNDKSEIFYEEQFKSLTPNVIITTVDGSGGVKGFATDVIANIDYDYFYTCGPEPMMRAVSKAVVTDGQYSFEERMGCGFGACMGCSCKTKTGSKRICKEGPILESGDIIW
ncbi:MAG: dihydroorotate dehydrogenase electron transfer subunit [Eubacteriales bacterium]|nr:dihydroorotate dehydrogenase electron transfer subunit [Eubacteriales bacterium]